MKSFLIPLFIAGVLATGLVAFIRSDMKQMDRRAQERAAVIDARGFTMREVTRPEIAVPSAYELTETATGRRWLIVRVNGGVTMVEITKP